MLRVKGETQLRLPRSDHGGDEQRGAQQFERKAGQEGGQGLFDHPHQREEQQRADRHQRRNPQAPGGVLAKRNGRGPTSHRPRRQSR